MADEDEVRVHRYRATCGWTGSTGGGYEAYDRTHEVASPPAATVSTLSADPAFRGDPALVNPEQLLVQAVVSCQLLSFLAVAARARLDVVSYQDDADAEMPEGERPWRITTVTLRPRVVVRAPASEEKVRRLMAVAHRECFIANSIRTAITIVPEVQIVG